jgi:TolB-like protein
LGEESPKPNTPTGAVFLSYASQDAETAQRICAALRSAGVEVWFDQSELRGGDAWDQSIRKQIKTCALFLPLISKHTHERAEGYFRLEWKLAVDRSHLIMANKAFLVPVVIDETADDDENVPDKFREVQWTHLSAGETPPWFVTRIQQLLSGESAQSTALARARAADSLGKSSRFKPAWLGVIVALAAVAAYVLVQKPWITKPAPLLAFAPPPHSIAVLPFVDMSEKKDQEYFSDGLSEELIDMLTKIPELRVPARTSSFYFKGKSETIATIARTLGVANVLEGSVRKAGNQLRVTAQLIRADNSYHLWSETYDRELKDVFKVQDEIAGAVVNALKLKLAPGQQAEHAHGTANTEAYMRYLLGRQLYFRANDAEGFSQAISAYQNAIALDPDYAAAYAGLALAKAFRADLVGDTTKGIADASRRREGRGIGLGAARGVYGS